MTPTEQDKELREAICNAMHIHPEELQYSLPNSFGESELEAIMQLIIADRRRVSLEARIDELGKLMNTTRINGDQVINQATYSMIFDRIAQLEKELEK